MNITPHLSKLFFGKFSSFTRPFVALSGLVCIASAQTYDANAQFSGTQNGGSSPWSYGYTNTIGGSFTPYSIDSGSGSAAAWLTSTGTGGNFVGWNYTDTFNGMNTGLPYYPFVLKNVASTNYLVDGNEGAGSYLSIPSEALVFCPSSANLSDVRLTIPSGVNGKFDVTSTFTRYQFNPSLAHNQEVGVLVNDVPLGTFNLSGNGAVEMLAFSALSLSSGDTIDFFVKAAPAADGGTIGLEATVQAVPEPTSLLALCVGMVAAGRRRSKLKGSRV